MSIQINPIENKVEYSLSYFILEEQKEYRVSFGKLHLFPTKHTKLIQKQISLKVSDKQLELLCTDGIKDLVLEIANKLIPDGFDFECINFNDAETTNVTQYFGSGISTFELDYENGKTTI